MGEVKPADVVIEHGSRRTAVGKGGKGASPRKTSKSRDVTQNDKTRASSLRRLLEAGQVVGGGWSDLRARERPEERRRKNQ